MYTLFKVLTIIFGCGFVVFAINAIKKDRNKWIDIVIPFFISAFFFFLVYPINQIEKKMETTTETSTTIESTTEPPTITTEPTTINTTEATTESNNVVKKTNEISKTLSYIDDYCVVTFVAPTSGKYRFDFLTNDTQTNYYVSLIDSKNETVMDSEYDTYEHGVTVELTKSEIYTLSINQKDGFPEATVKIHVPSENAVLEFSD